MRFDKDTEEGFIRGLQKPFNVELKVLTPSHSTHHLRVCYYYHHHHHHGRRSCKEQHKLINVPQFVMESKKTLMGDVVLVLCCLLGLVNSWWVDEAKDGGGIVTGEDLTNEL